MLYKMTKQRYSHLDPDDALLPNAKEIEKAVKEQKNEDDDEDNDEDEDEDEEEEEEEEDGSEPEEDEEDILDGNVLMVDQLW
jgi:hypothetical protein